MRLLDAETIYLQTYTDSSQAPPYAILSHCWGQEKDEVTVQMMKGYEKYGTTDELRYCPGWQKVVDFCVTSQAIGQFSEIPVRHAWVDTACIDRTSSAELSESLNSMFRWYSDAAICFVFLADVDAVLQVDGSVVVGPDFEKSRWFTRGWTLQELLAPKELHFYDRNWQYLGDRDRLHDRISECTGIGMDVLLRRSWKSVCIAHRMSWASKRFTTRREDAAYCMMGLFDVNMPILYGEGDKAFLRLQEEILKGSPDQSILVWDASRFQDSTLASVGALAPSPVFFHEGSNVEVTYSPSRLMQLTPLGLMFPFKITEYHAGGGVRRQIAQIACRYANDMTSRIGIPVAVESQTRTGEAIYMRLRNSPVSIPQERATLQGSNASGDRMGYILTRAKRQPPKPPISRCWVDWSRMPEGLLFLEAAPGQHWVANPVSRAATMLFPRSPGNPERIFPAVIAFKLRNRLEYVYLILHLQAEQKSVLIGWEMSANGNYANVPTKLRVMMDESVNYATRSSCRIELPGSYFLTATARVDVKESVGMFKVEIFPGNSQ